MAGFDLSLHQSDAAAQYADELADLYRAAYSEQEPQRSDPFYSRERFLERLAGYQRAPGFQLVTARDRYGLVAFLYGYPLPPTSRWWSIVDPPPSPEFATETGSRTFAINDMVVDPPWRRRGIARAMHDELLEAHPGMRITLTMRPDNAPARAAYLAWGYQIIGQQQPYPDSPVFETMLLNPRR